jgi:hypothetical protein
LLSFCEPVDAGADYIEFRNTGDGAVWRHGSNKEEGHWTTEELMRTPGPLVGKPVTDTKKAVKGEVVDVETLTLIQRYPPSDSRLIWETADFGDTNDTGAFFDWVSENYGPITGAFKNAEYEAREYGKRFLAVVYRKENYAAIWEGVE